MKGLKKRYILFAGILVLGIILALFFRHYARDEEILFLKHKQGLNVYLTPRILEEMQDFNGKIGIALYDLDTKESLMINAKESFRAASLIKIPVMLEFFKQLQEKKISMEMQVTYNVRDRAGGFGRVQQYSIGTRFKLQQLLQWMIQYSDNDATNILIRILGPKKINKSLQEKGLNKSLIRHHLPRSYPPEKRRNLTTPYEILQMFKMIYDQEIYTPENTKKMVKILQSQVLNEEMPRYLPKGTLIGHKTGLLQGVVHDVGIVSLYDRKYILCLLSEGRMSLAEQTKSLGRISRMIYNYFSYNRGPFLLGASSRGKKNRGVLLLAGHSYLTGQMKDLAEYFQRKGIVVYCLPFQEKQKSTIDGSFQNNIEQIEQGLALLRRYSHKQYVVASTLESLYFLEQFPERKIEALIFVPNKAEKKFMRSRKIVNFWVPLKNRILRNKGFFFQDQVFYFDQIKRNADEKNIKYKQPIYLISSPVFLEWLKPVIRPPYFYGKEKNKDFIGWGEDDFKKVYSFIKMVDKEKRR